MKLIKKNLAFKLLNVGLVLSVACTSRNSIATEYEYLPPPQIRTAIDSHGVDMISGTYRIPGMKVNIGTEESGLNAESTHSQRFHNTYTGTMTSMSQSGGYYFSDPLYGLPNGSYIKVDALGRSEVFQGNGSIYTNSKNSGGKFSCVGNICTYLIPDGTTATFDKTIKHDFRLGDFVIPLTVAESSSIPRIVGEMTKIIKNDGEVIDISFSQPVSGTTNSYIRAVTSSLGWMISFKHGNWEGYGNSNMRSIVTDTIQAINTSVEYCSPLAETCNGLVNNWQLASRSIDDTWSVVTGKSGMLLHVVEKKVTNALGKSDSYHLTINKPLFLAIEDSYKSFAGISLKFTHSSNGCQYDSSACLPEQMYNILGMTVGGEKTFSYSAPGYEIVGPDGKFGVNVKTSRPSSYTDNLNRKWTYTYVDIWGYRVDKIIDPDATPNQTSPTGGYTQYSYDLRGNVTAITAYPKNSGSPSVISATYPDAGSTTCSNTKTCNKPLTVTDQNGVTTSYTYDPTHGGVRTVTKPAVNGVQAQIVYNYSQLTPYVKNSSNSLVANAPVWRLTSTSKCMTQTLNTCVGTADELRTEYSDFTNNLLSKKTVVKHGDGSVVLTTTRDYDIYGNVSWEDGPRPGSYDTVYYFYDALRQKVGEIGVDPDGSGPLPRQAKRFTYNDDGKLLSTEIGVVSGTTKSDVDTMTAREKTETEYSIVTGLPIAERYYAAGSLKKLAQKNYDANLRVNCVAQRLSLSTAPDACTPASSVDGNDRITKFSYDATGAVTTTTSAYGITGVQRNDRVNTYYPENGLLKSEADGLGNTTVYQYDDFKRPWKTIYPTAANGTVSSTTDYTQNNYTNNFVSSVRLRDGLVINFQPDSLYRVKSKSGALVESFTYNNFDQVVSHTNSTTGGVVATSTYDRKAIGWLNNETRTAGGTSLGVVSYQYDTYGRRSQLKWPDNNLTVYYDYDVNGYPADYLQKVTDSSGAQLASYTYYDIGKRKSLTRGNGVVTNYHYDEQQRLDTLSTDVGGSSIADDISESFSYNLAGQIKNRVMTATNSGYFYTPSISAANNYVPNSLNQIASQNGVTFEYDGRGNLTKDNTGRTYTYSANNLLLNSTLAGATTSLSYDAENRLFNAVNSSTNTKFTYDGTNLIAETDSNNAILRRYVPGPDTDEPLARYEGSGTNDRSYYTTDRQGSVVGITSQSGAQSATNAYDEYGIQKVLGIGRFQYTGQIWIASLGLYYYKARFYSPTLGRFLQTDPIGYKNGMNWYSYVGSDPVNKTDPTGTRCVGSGDDSKCTIDRVNTGTKEKPNWVSRSDAVESGAVSNDALTKLEGSITSAFQQAQTVGDKFVEMIQPDGKSKVKITGNEVANALRGATSLNYKASPWYASDAGIAVTNRVDSEITYKRKALNESSIHQMRTTLHEGMHLTPNVLWNNEPEHQDPFTKAAEDMLNIK